MSEAFKSMFERTSTLTEITADDYAVVLVNGNVAKIKYSDVAQLFGTTTVSSGAGTGSTTPPTAGSGPSIASGAYTPIDQSLTLTKSDGTTVTISLVNLLGSVLKPGDAGLYPGVVQFAGVEVQRYQYIETNIPINSSIMVRLDLVGFPYGPGGFTDLSISFYTYNDPLGVNLFHNPTYLSRGTLEPAGLSGGFVNGKLVLAIDWGSAIYFNRYVISAHCNSTASNKSFFTGWTVKNGELPPTADHSKAITKKSKTHLESRAGF